MLDMADGFENSVGGVVQSVSSASTTEELSSSIQEISRQVAQSTDIADQTNLLALNATIEAARAGDAGKALP